MELKRRIDLIKIVNEIENKKNKENLEVAMKAFEEWKDKFNKDDLANIIEGSRLARPEITIKAFELWKNRFDKDEFYKDELTSFVKYSSNLEVAMKLFELWKDMFDKDNLCDIFS